MVDIISFEERKKDSERENNYFVRYCYHRYKCPECKNVGDYPPELPVPTCFGKDIVKHDEVFMIRIDTKEEKRVRRMKLKRAHLKYCLEKDKVRSDLKIVNLEKKVRE